ncbi:stage IV sporulation protein FB [Symbiobacterium terraclitae]|uniref:Stage IV sporulation protein FB n=1 Tax=Symbiobacterium terraclitae TaxID=557451 RepID=A0ABS4JWM4_9FIRM|nr:stage IV sporulation protein FB [Symbiobacterium terraclitae]
MRLGQFGGVRVEVHWLFLLALVAACVSGYYMEVLILVGSLAAHELAHLTVAWLLGVEVDSLLLTPLGGMARLDTALELDPQSEVSVALAGPVQSFLLAGLASFLMGDALFDPSLVRFFFQVNANLAFFNLIPALPLDGGRALRGLLAQRWGYRRTTIWSTRLGLLCGAVMSAAALGVLAASGQLFLTPLAGGLFLILGALAEGEEAVFRSYRQFLHKRQRMARQRLIPGGSLVVVEGTRIGEVLEHLSDRRYHLVLVVDRALLPVGTLHEAEIMDAFQELGPRATVEEVLDR